MDEFIGYVGKKHADCSELYRTSDTWTDLSNMDDWTKEDVCQWLLKLKVPNYYADILYNEDVSGAALICFTKQDFLDAGLKHGPAVQILKNIAEFTENFKHSPASLSPELDRPAPFSIQEDGTSGVERWDCSEDIPKHIDRVGNSLNDKLYFQSEKDLIFGERDQGNGPTEQSVAHCTKLTSNVRSETEEQPSNHMKESKSLHFCKPRPFDESSITFEYTQNEMLPPETGPSNRIDPVHEYKLLANTENASEEDVLEKFSCETCWFAAACMNTRTNGTIHFGVGDEPLHLHGQIIGIDLQSPNRYIDKFYKGLKEHFKAKTNIAMECIRPPKFVKVKCPDKVRWVIEIDIVPTYKLTQKKLFYTTLDKKKQKSRCLFIRSGASTINYLPENNPKIYKQNKRNLKNDLELWVSCRQSAEERVAQERPVLLLLGQCPVELISNQLAHTDLQVSSESESQTV